MYQLHKICSHFFIFYFQKRQCACSAKSHSVEHQPGVVRVDIQGTQIKFLGSVSAAE
jgi:hypothetical protein